MNVNRIKHQRYLTMADTIGVFGGLVLLNAGGKIANVVPKGRESNLIPPGFEVRGAVIYASSKPHYDDINNYLSAGIKEIYFAAEGNSIWQTSSGQLVEGINYEDDINDLTAQIRLSGRTDVPSET